MNVCDLALVAVCLLPECHLRQGDPTKSLLLHLAYFTSHSASSTCLRLWWVAGSQTMRLLLMRPPRGSRPGRQCAGGAARARAWLQLRAQRAQVDYPSYPVLAPSPAQHSAYGAAFSDGGYRHQGDNGLSRPPAYGAPEFRHPGDAAYPGNPGLYAAEPAYAAGGQPHAGPYGGLPGAGYGPGAGGPGEFGAAGPGAGYGGGGAGGAGGGSAPGLLQQQVHQAQPQAAQAQHAGQPQPQPQADYAYAYARHDGGAAEYAAASAPAQAAAQYGHALAPERQAAYYAAPAAAQAAPAPGYAANPQPDPNPYGAQQYAQAPAGAGPAWSEHRAPDGRAYFHCVATGATQWERPASMA